MVLVDCASCAYGVDLRCHPYPGGKATGPFHRIHDCLLPYLHHLEEALREPLGACVVGSHSSVLRFVEPLLSGALLETAASHAPLRLLEAGKHPLTSSVAELRGAVTREKSAYVLD